MNRIQITTKKENSDGKEKVELTLSSEIQNDVMSAIKSRHLIAVLQGETKRVENNMIYYCFYLATDDAEELKEAFLGNYIGVRPRLFLPCYILSM